MNKLERLIEKKITKGIMKYKMIEDGDRVLMGVSGGKDSMLLAYHLSKKSKSFPINFEFKVLHIESEFGNAAEKANMIKLLEEWGVDYEILPVGVIKRLKPGRKMNCYWCSTQRRTELLKYAVEKGYNKIALGHHMDDIVESLMMNMALKGKISTMLPILKYDRYEQSIIRPLCYVQEHEIIKMADNMGITKCTCQCGFADNSKRRDMRNIIQQMADTHGNIVRDNLYKSMSNIVDRYLPDPD
ncbi:MAG: tRNA 2-thiocytidine biosynthesis protein TtcA [Spirochaetales bacterium]|nr:tRNA 2-thiocytidine biosynthesis protein TtcA [Spirochaetales bacterium]